MIITTQVKAVCILQEWDYKLSSRLWNGKWKAVLTWRPYKLISRCVTRAHLANNMFSIDYAQMAFTLNGGCQSQGLCGHNQLQRREQK